MPRRLRSCLLVAAACVVVAALGALLWLPWNPLEDDAGPLDEWIPSEAELVIRLDPGGIRSAPGALALWEGPGGRRVRDDLGLDVALQSLRDIDRRLREIPVPGGPLTMERDFAGREVLLALAGDDVLLMTRISGRAKSLDLLRRADDARLANLGLRTEGAGFAADRDGRTFRFARRRDVLFVATSRPLLDAAVRIADGGEGSLFDRGDFRGNRPPKPSGPRAGAWVKGDLVGRHVPGHPFVRRLVDSARTGGLRIDADFGAAERVAFALHVRDAAELRSSASVALHVRAAERLAPEATTIAAGGFVIDSQDAVATLVDAQPQARRRLLDDLLAERESSLAAVVRDLASHVAPGVGFVVARLPETDSLRLDAPEGDVAEPIPATLAVFRLRDDGAEGLLADLRRYAEALFGADSRLVEEAGPGGALVLRADTRGFGPEWRLLTPALAVSGQDVIFSTNHAQLLRSLALPRSGGGPGADAGALRVEGAAFRAWLRDLRWERADRACFHDWAAERRAIRAEMDRAGPPMSPLERQRREDDEIDRRIRVRSEVEFPRALAAWETSLRWLEQFTRLEAAADVDSDGGATVRVEIALAPR